MDKRTLTMLLLCVAGIGVAVYLARNWDSQRRDGQAEGPFGIGRGKVTEGRYHEAIPLLEEYLREFPTGRNASRARFFLGKAHIGLGELEQARTEFDATIRDYPDSLEAHKSRYKLALVELSGGNTEAAQRRFARLAEDPDGPLTPEARAMSAYLAGEMDSAEIDSQTETETPQ